MKIHRTQAPAVLRPEQSAAVALKPGSQERFFDGAGQLNAGDRKDAIKTLANLMTLAQSGDLVMASPDEIQATDRISRVAQRMDLASALNNGDNTPFRELGAAVGLEITEILGREGIMRRLLAKADLDDGEKPRIRIRTRNVTAFLATGVGKISPIYPRDRYIEMPEFYIGLNTRVTELDIRQGAPDLLEDVFLKSQEAIVVGEDRTFMNLIRKGVGVSNDYVALIGGLTPANLIAMRTAIARWNLEAVNLVIGTNVWSDILAGTDTFGKMFDPVTQFEIVRNGTLGRLYGMNIITDGFRDENQKVLLPNEVLITGQPENLGGFTDRGPVQANPVDSYADGIPSRGWFTFEMVSMAIANPRAYTLGIRA